MARPQRKAIDYFPLDCSMDDSVKFIEAKHGLTGFALLVKLWSKIYSSEGYYCEWSEKNKYLFCKEHNIEVELIDGILNTCFNEGVFDRGLFNTHSVLTSKGVQKRYFKIIKDGKRNYLEINPKLYLLENSSGINPLNSGTKGDNSGVYTTKESKVKESKEKVKREKEKSPPEKAKSDNPDKKTPAGKKEKSCAKKEKDVYRDCKAVFLNEAKGYYWEAKDDRELKQLLTKLDSVFEQVLSGQELTENFTLLICNLPKYWRTKKFTIHHINQNFNEIINEIQSNHNGTNKQGNTGTNEKFGRHSTDELAKRAFTFGR